MTAALPPPAELHRWLKRAGRQLVPRFPPIVEAYYTQQTRAGRMRAMRLCTLAGWCMGLLLAFLGWPMLSDAQDVILHVWLGIAIPLGITCSLLQLLPGPTLQAQEWQSTIVVLIVGACMTYLLMHTRHAPTGFLFGGSVLLILLDGTAARLSLLPAATLVLGMAAMFSFGIQHIPAAEPLDPFAVPMMIMLMAACAASALYGSWRLETEVRRAFALALLERIERRALVRRNEELGQMLGDDPLTGLANRRGFDQFLTEAWARAVDAGANVSLIIADVDSFKVYNDTYGHPAGDACLRAIAEALRTQLRGVTEMIARLDGEEFAVVITGVDHAAAINAAEGVRLAVQTLATPNRASPLGYLTISAGVATLRAEPGIDPTKLVQAADQALYGTKRSGPNRVSAAIGLHLIQAAE